MLLGDVPSTQDPTVQEISLYRGAATIGTGQTLSWQLGQFTMPFTGSLVIRMMSSLNWTGAQYTVFNLDLCTPAWTNGYAGEMAADSGGGYPTTITIPALAWWASLSQGTVVTAIGKIYAGGGPAINLAEMYGYARMCLG